MRATTQVTIIGIREGISPKGKKYKYLEVVDEENQRWNLFGSIPEGIEKKAQQQELVELQITKRIKDGQFITEVRLANDN